jgi:uncharacterized protein
VNALLRQLAGNVERRPGVALSVVLLLTVVFGVFATQQTTDTDLAAFAPESGLAEANERIAEEFGTSTAAVQVIVDAGRGGDALSPDGLAAVRAIEAVATGTPEVADVLAPPTPQAPTVYSYALPFEAALVEQGTDPTAVGAEELDQLAAGLLADPRSGPQAGALLSQDLDADAGTARAGLVVVRLAPGLDVDAQAAGELALRDALRSADLGPFTVTSFSESILGEDLLRDMEEEMPVLLGLAFLLILGILFATYRRVSDLLLGLTGLVVTIVWTYGIAVLLGPGYLEVTGPMTQISMMIPVLLIGLAIDFAIHLTSRYREELAKGRTSPVAAHGAVFSVGGALVLATLTTMIGFLTNVVSPLPPIRDFGIFVAAGVLAAFVVMLLLVPSARVLLDTRRARKGTYVAPASGTDTRVGRLMSRAAVLAEHHAEATLAVAALLTLVAGVAGSQVSTTFSQDDFIPEDSEIGDLTASMTELFGGDLDETTYVLLEGGVASPEAANAMLEAQARMGDTENVRGAAGQAQVSSPVALVAGLAASDPQLTERLAQLGYVAGEGFAPDADVAAVYAVARQAAPEEAAGVLNDEGDLAVLAVATSAGQDGADALRDDLAEDLAPLEAAGLTTTVVSEPLMLDESLDALTDSQSRGIVITLIAALIVLVGFFTLRGRRPMLGVVAMIPSIFVVAWVSGSMLALGISFNVMTAMVASLAIGIGVPYGIHIANRFTEDLEALDSIDDAVRETVTHTGGALLGSAATTAAGFGVLGFASLAPMRQFGIITALTIVYSLVAAVLVEPACLKLWAQWRQRRDDDPVRAEVPVAEPAAL